MPMETGVNVHQFVRRWERVCLEGIWKLDGGRDQRPPPYLMPHECGAQGCGTDILWRQMANETLMFGQLRREEWGRAASPRISLSNVLHRNRPVRHQPKLLASSAAAALPWPQVVSPI